MTRTLLATLLLLVLSSGCAIVAREHYYTMSADNAAIGQNFLYLQASLIGHNDGNILKFDPDIHVEIESENKAITVATAGPYFIIPLPVIPVYPITMLLPPYFDQKTFRLEIDINELENHPVTLDTALFVLSTVDENKKYFPIKVELHESIIKELLSCIYIAVEYM